MNISKTIQITIILFGIGLLFLTCKQTNEPEKIDETGIVIPGVGMDGIKLGDTKETVLEKLGEPSLAGLADGPRRAWETFYYDEGKHVGIVIYFLSSGAEYDTVDLIAGSITNEGIAYSGETQEGIKLGLKRDEVYKLFGFPDTSSDYQNGTYIYEYYCINEKRFAITYEDSIAIAMSSSYYKPMQGTPCYE